MSIPEVEREWRRLEEEKHKQRVEIIEARHAQNLAFLRIIALIVGGTATIMATAALVLVWTSNTQHGDILRAQQETAEAMRINALAYLTPAANQKEMAKFVLEGMNKFTRDRIRRQLGYLDEAEAGPLQRDTGALQDFQGGPRRPR